MPPLRQRRRKLDLNRLMRRIICQVPKLEGIGLEIVELVPWWPLHHAVGVPHVGGSGRNGRRSSVKFAKREGDSGVHLTRQKVFDQLESSVADRPLRIKIGLGRMGMELGEQVRSPGGVLSRQQRHQGHTGQSLDRRGLGDGEKRRREVDGRNQLGPHLAGRAVARPADDQGDPQPPLVAGPLSAQHVGSMISDTDDQRVLRLPRAVQRRQQIAHERVQPHHAIVVIRNRLAELRRVDAE